MSTPSLKLKPMGKETASPDTAHEEFSVAQADWMGDCRIMVRNALCGREVQRKCIVAGLGVRNKGGPITEQQQEEIMRRLARGDQLRQLAADWQILDQRNCQTGRTISTEQATMQPRRLAYLSTIGLAPKPPSLIAARLGTEPRRATIDLDQRMTQATEMVESGSTW